MDRNTNVANLLHPIACHSTHGAWKTIIISISGPFLASFPGAISFRSAGLKGSFCRGTVNWPSVMRLCCQFLGFLCLSIWVKYHLKCNNIKGQYENKSSSYLTNPLFCTCNSHWWKIFLAMSTLLKDRLFHRKRLLDRALVFWPGPTRKWQWRQWQLSSVMILEKDYCRTHGIHGLYITVVSRFTYMHWPKTST